VFLVALVLSGVLAVGSTPSDCAAVQKAYETFRTSSFRMERELAIEVDGKARGRRISRLEWKDGKFKETVITTEAPKGESMEIDGDPSVKLAPPCEKITSRSDGEVEIDSGDGERVVFRMDETRGALLPTRWTAVQTVKILFVKKRISFSATIRDFHWE
jgi:hypothetical protein